LVQTSMAHYFLAISAGAFNQNNTVVYCISTNAPIAKLLLGKEKGERFTFNGTEQEILEVD